MSSWTATQQASAEKQAADFKQEFGAAIEAWQNAILSGRVGNSQAIVEDVVRRWRLSVDRLKAQSDSILSSETTMESLGALASQTADKKEILAKLRAQAITRVDQADSVNPKVRGSPYTNILGLQRTFRESTRINIIVASFVFGGLALGALGALAYGIATVRDSGTSLSENQHGGRGRGRRHSR